ncbi:MAG TPA: hypothetical protein VEF33_14675 [Syntrophales bacterium]|nr:hypothetical protein [Syntrophales bacterium]
MEQESSPNEFVYEYGHDHRPISLAIRWLLSVFIVAVLLFLLKPFLVELMLVRESSYFSSYYFDEAVRMSKKIVFIDKTNIRGWTSFGKAYKEKAIIDRYAGEYDKERNDIDNSIEAYERAFSIDPKDVRLGFEIGMLYFSKKEFTNAVRYFEYVLNMGAGSGETPRADILGYHNMSLTMLHRCYESLGDTIKAEQIQKELKQYIIK